MGDRRVAGNTTGSLALLLVLLLGAGGWNYHRNYQHELASAKTRPYSSYSARDVELLRDAVVAELEVARARLSRAKKGRARAVRDQGTVAGNVRQFDRTARASDAIRAASGDVAEREGMKAALDRELESRADAGTGWMLHLKRLTTL
ncbi:MAG: hypothetical protein R3F35_02360 [Myxococcota bacterium]